MAVTEQERTVDLDALARDAETRLLELRQQVQRLSLDALTDPKVAQELADVRSEIASAEGVLEQVALARVEAGRRAEVERERLAAEARAEALREAQALQHDRQQAAGVVDQFLEGLGVAVVEWMTKCDEQDVQLQRAGRRMATNAAQARAIALTAAWCHHMRPLPRGLLALEGFPPSSRQWVPLAEGDLRPVAAVSKPKKG